MATDRLQKVLARAGVASRRAAEALISAGRVRVDGKVVSELGTKVDPRASKVEVDGKRVFAESFVYVAFHKPRNVVATLSDPEGRPTVKAYLTGVPGRIYPIGRLDFATSGLLLVTNDGDFAETLLHPRRAVPKTYVVKVLGEMSDDDLDTWRKGIRLEDGPTLPAKVKLLRHEEGKTWIELTITEGRNQQIRRMGDATGFRVMRLARLAFAGISSEGLAPGLWRYLTRDELATLKKEYGVPQRLVSPPEDPKRPKASPQRSAPSRAASDARDAGHPRYGGGSPGRRDLAVRDDWGGGVGRGSSGRRDSSPSDAAPRADVGGRAGRTRTTGTGGGIGSRTDGGGGRGAGGGRDGGGEATDASYRVKSRRPRGR